MEGKEVKKDLKLMNESQIWKYLRDYLSHGGNSYSTKISSDVREAMFWPDSFSRQVGNVAIKRVTGTASLNYKTGKYFRITEMNFHPILNILAKLGFSFGITSAIFDILGSIGLPLRGLGSLVGNFNSKVRNQVLNVDIRTAVFRQNHSKLISIWGPNRTAVNIWIISNLATLPRCYILDIYSRQTGLK